MKKLIRHFRRWNIWRKRNTNSPLHKFLVLIGFVVSPTMVFTYLPEEIEEFITDPKYYFINEEIVEKSRIIIHD